MTEEMAAMVTYTVDSFGLYSMAVPERVLGSERARDLPEYIAEHHGGMVRVRSFDVAIRKVER